MFKHLNKFQSFSKHFLKLNNNISKLLIKLPTKNFLKPHYRRQEPKIYETELPIEPDALEKFTSKMDLNKKKHFKIPKFCNLFELASLLEVDPVQLLQNFKDTISLEINDSLEYIEKDDLELYLLEKEIDFEVTEHKSEQIKKSMVVTIMGHVDHGN